MMMNSTLIQTILILCVWLVMLASLTGIGQFVLARLKKRLPLDVSLGADWGDSFWTGWVVVICFLQIWHILFRVHGFLIILTAVAGSASLIYHIRRANPRPQIDRRLLFFFIVLAGLTGLCLANRALWYLEPLSGFTQWDTGSYHVQAVKWNARFPLTPGLANINHYFGFNSNYFLYASFFDFWIWAERTSYLATGLLMYAMILQALGGIARIFSNEATGANLGFYQGLTLVPLLTKASYVNSLETDLPIFLLMLLLGGQVYLFFLEREKRPQHQLYRVFFITILVLTGLTIKMNFAMYGMLTLIVVGGTTLIDHRRRVGNWALTYLPLLAGSFGVILLPWLFRSVILSGYPLFPSTALAFNVSWRVPEKVAIEEYGHIRTVARVIKSGVDEAVIHGWDWFPAWVRAIPDYLVKLVNLGFVAILTLAMPFAQSARSRSRWWVFAPILGAVLFWFWMAPAVRFIEGAFWSAALLLICFAVERLELGANVSGRLARWLLLAGLFLWMMPFSTPLFITVTATNPLEYLQPYQPELAANISQTGLTVWTPLNPQDRLRCWSAPLPCAPVFNKRLASFTFRLAGQTRNGYYLK